LKKGSWNAAFSPRTNLAVVRLEKPSCQEGEAQQSINDLTYHHAFALFMTYAAIINIPICIYWAGGPHRTYAILAETNLTSLVLVSVFSIIWGIGTVLFGLACKIAGVGLGTNLSMGIIAVIGTFLPLIIKDTLISAAGGVICVGLAICCGGLWLATKALAMRDRNEREQDIGKEIPDTKNTLNADRLDIENVDRELDDKLRYDESMAAKTSRQEADSVILEPKLKDGSIENMVADNECDNDNDDGHKDQIHLAEVDSVQYPTWKKIGICVATGICASQLQFAFVFGEEITDLALGNENSGKVIPGSTPESGGAAIIWLLAISLAAPVAIINGLYSSPVPLSSAVKTPLSRHLKLIFSTSLPFLAHIHIYGVCATVLLPDNIASSVGWPMLMMVTSGQALVLSVFLGEWKAASKETIRTLKGSILTTVVGIGVLMTSVAVPTNE
jgi:hypothetical protein